MDQRLHQCQELAQQLRLELGEEITISGLVGSLHLLQRAKGHRHSLDDAVTAWYALQKAPGSISALDLGSGVGSCGLAVLWGLQPENNPQVHLTAVEAQEISYRFLQANIQGNNLSSVVTPILSDLRDLHLDKKFDLITGTPPYFPANAGIVPSDSQKAHARFELRGTIGDYAKTARRHLKPEGWFVFCFPTAQRQRCIDLVTEQGFHLVSARDVYPHPDKPALITLFSARLTPDIPFVEEPPLIVGDASGKYTPEMLALQATRGFGKEGTNRKYSPS